MIHSDLAFVYVTRVRACNSPYRCAYFYEEGFPLVSLAGNVEGDWPWTSDLCDLRGCIYEHSSHPRL